MCKIDWAERMLQVKICLAQVSEARWSKVAGKG